MDDHRHPGGVGPVRVGRPPGPLDDVATLEHFEASLTSLRSAVTEVELSPSYLMLLDADPSTETGRRYGSAAKEGRDLWALLDAATALLGAARSHADQSGRGAADRAELARLLGERWYSVTQLAGPPRAFAAPELLAEIRRRYDALRGAVADIDLLWTSILPRIEAAKSTLERLEGDVDDLGVPEPLIKRARALAEDLAERLVADPASVHSKDGLNLDQQVAAAAKQVASLRSGHENLSADLGATEELLASLRVLLARASSARDEASAKVANPEGLVRVPSEAILDGPDGLGVRLDQLFETKGNTWSQQRTLLDAWLSTARKLETQLSSAVQANRAPIEARNELRGRLRAYTAKMAAMGLAEDLELVELADRARESLYSAPTELSTAEAAITDLAARLRP